MDADGGPKFEFCCRFHSRCRPDGTFLTMEQESSTHYSVRVRGHDGEILALMSKEKATKSQHFNAAVPKMSAMDEVVKRSS